MPLMHCLLPDDLHSQLKMLAQHAGVAPGSLLKVAVSEYIQSRLQGAET